MKSDIISPLTSLKEQSGSIHTANYLHSFEDDGQNILPILDVTYTSALNSNHFYFDDLSVYLKLL